MSYIERLEYYLFTRSLTSAPTESVELWVICSLNVAMLASVLKYVYGGSFTFKTKVDERMIKWQLTNVVTFDS